MIIITSNLTMLWQDFSPSPSFGFCLVVFWKLLSLNSVKSPAQGDWKRKVKTYEFIGSFHLLDIDNGVVVFSNAIF